MRNRLSLGLLSVAILTMASCQPASKSVVGSGSAKKELKPFLKLEEHQEKGKSVGTWDVQAFGVKQLTLRLLVLSDGKSQSKQEATYQWNNWPKDQLEATWRLHFKTQSNDSPGAAASRRYSFDVDFENAKPDTITPQGGQAEVTGQFNWQNQEVRSKAIIDSGEQRIICLKIFDPVQGDKKIEYNSSSIESLLKITTGGRVVLVLTMEWK